MRKTTAFIIATVVAFYTGYYIGRQAMIEDVQAAFYKGIKTAHHVGVIEVPKGTSYIVLESGTKVYFNK